MIPFSHRNMLAAASRLQAWYDLTPQDCCLSRHPSLLFARAESDGIYAASRGRNRCVPNGCFEVRLFRMVRELEADVVFGRADAPSLGLDQIKSRAGAKTDHSLRFVVSGGAPLPRDILEGLQHSLGVPVVEQYGTSEAAVVASQLATCRVVMKPGTCGVPWPDTVVIASEDGRPVPPGEKGEILLGGPSLISGYLDAPELNSHVFHRRVV